MFISKKINLTNNVRHRRELMWDSFLIHKTNKKYKKSHFSYFNEYKLAAYCVRNFYYNKYSKKIYALVSDYANNSIVTPNKYGFNVGHIASTQYYNFLIFKKLESDEINKVFLKACMEGTLIYYINNPINGVNIATTSGVFAVVYKQVKDTNLTKIKLPSGQFKLLPCFSEAYAGRNGNLYFKYVVWGSWGFKFKHKDHRPVVRGIAMNPIDHPNGGRSKVKKPFRNKYFKIAKKGK